MDKSSPAEMWTSILTKFGGKGAQSAVHLIHELTRSTLDDDNDMSSQINGFKETARKLANLGYPFHDHVIAGMLIIALPPSYSTIRTVLTDLAITTLDLDSVIETVLAEESHSKGAECKHFEGTHRP
jgi:hypothetical protein